MNESRMLKLADAIERSAIPNVNFNMAFVAGVLSGSLSNRVAQVYECGAVCCNAGWACLLFGEPNSIVDSLAARVLLDLTGGQAYNLFYNGYNYMGDYGGSLADIPRSAAVAAIRRMVREEGNLVPMPVIEKVTEKELVAV